MEANGKVAHSPFFYAPFAHVAVERTNSSFGNWVVKTSEVTFTFFFSHAKAQAFAASHNQKMQGAA